VQALSNDTADAAGPSDKLRQNISALCSAFDSGGRCGPYSCPLSSRATVATTAAGLLDCACCQGYGHSCARGWVDAYPNGSKLPKPVAVAINGSYRCGRCDCGPGFVYCPVSLKRLVVESPWSQLTSECQRF
jgi:hypothetical protein